MKKILSILFTGVLVATTALSASAQIEMTRQVSGFNSIASSGSFNVHVKIDGTESLKISADESIIDDIETTVSGGKLKIGLKNKISWRIFNSKKVDIYITAKSLSGLSNSGSGNLKLESGQLIGNANVIVSGSANLTAVVNAGQLNTTVSGSGSVNLTGTAKNAEITVSGSGNINAKTLTTEAVDANISGSGNIYIIANKSINAHVSGSGRLVYTGTATNINSSTSGSGRVVKAK